MGLGEREKQGVASIRYTFISCDDPGADGRLGFLAVRPTRALSSLRFAALE